MMIKLNRSINIVILLGVLFASTVFAQEINVGDVVGQALDAVEEDIVTETILLDESNAMNISGILESVKSEKGSNYYR